MGNSSKGKYLLVYMNLVTVDHGTLLLLSRDYTIKPVWSKHLLEQIQFSKKLAYDFGHSVYRVKAMKLVFVASR